MSAKPSLSSSVSTQFGLLSPSASGDLLEAGSGFEPHAVSSASVWPSLSTPSQVSGAGAALQTPFVAWGSQLYVKFGLLPYSAAQSHTVAGARLVMELRGVSCQPLETTPPAKKPITTSRRFPAAVSEYEELKESVSFFISRCAEKLRRARLAASVITVFIQTSRFSPEAQYANSVTLEMVYPPDNTQEAAAVSPTARSAV